jgi:photosystem II stability/assembly factor-like uncharacterized protein
LLTALPAHAQRPYEVVRADHKFDLWDVAFCDTLRGIAVGNFGEILTTTDGGTSWTQQISKEQLAFRKVLYFTPRVAIACGFWSTMFRTTDEGKTWAEIPFPDRRMLIGVARIDSATAWICGDKGLLMKTTDAGAHWTEYSSSTDKMLESISFADSLNGWCSSSQGILLHTTNGGRRWIWQKTGSPFPTTAVLARSSTECWAAGYTGLIACTTDGGDQWSFKTAYETNYTRILFDREGIGWAVGARGAIVREDKTRGKWAVYSTVPISAFNALAVLANKKLIAVGTDGTIVKMDVR